MKRPAHSVAGRSTTQEMHIAPTLSRSATRLLGQAKHATTSAKWILAAATIGAVLIFLPIASHVRGSAPIEQIRGTPVVKTNVPAGVESAHAAAGPGSALPASPGIPDARFRFGFLEFEDDPDARANDFQRCDRRPHGC